jgi:hypothetical protein
VHEEEWPKNRILRDQIHEEQKRNPLDVKTIKILVEHLPYVCRQRLLRNVLDFDDSQKQVNGISRNKK